MQIGIDSFAALVPDPITQSVPTPAERLQNLVEEIALADQVGLDAFGIGEHHRAEYLDSAPAVILAAAASRTKNIRLSSAVTVLSAADPVRVFQQFATLDLISNGRAEIVAGRGSFIESFPLFGLKLEDYDSLFAEKLDLLLKIRDTTNITWSGKHRAPLTGQGIYPRPLQNPLPLWLGVGGTPGVLRPRRSPRPSPHGRHHRRRTPPFPPSHRPLPRSRSPFRPRPRKTKSRPPHARLRSRNLHPGLRRLLPRLRQILHRDRQRTWLATHHPSSVRSPPPPHRSPHRKGDPNEVAEKSSTSTKH